MSNYTKSTASNTLPKMEAGAAASFDSEKTPRSESLSSYCFAVIYGVSAGKPFATIQRKPAADNIGPIYAHTPGGWLNADFYDSRTQAAEQLEAVSRMLVRFA